MTDTDALRTAADGALAVGQWRLAEVQLANWGTFDGVIHRVPIARQGHLLTGPSGSGKSSLLDAIAAVLTPDKWLRFNQAAQGAGARTEQRGLVSYVRGAFSRAEDETDGRVVSTYLRPGSTWSGILLRYEDGGGGTASLARLFFLKKSGSALADLQDLCLIERGPVDLRDLEDFARGGIEARKAQARWPDALITTNRSHGRFYARLQSIFGIAQENALQLLHKTQSAKNLDSLDQLFRDFMLDRPATFDIAETAREQFGELRDAHDRVVDLRRQRDHLLQLRDASTVLDAAQLDVGRSQVLIDANVPYQKGEALRLVREELGDLDERIAQLEIDAERARAVAARAEDTYLAARDAAMERGGAEAEHLQQRLDDARRAARDVGERWETLARQLATVGIEHAPETAEEFTELRAAIDRELGEATSVTGATHPQHERLTVAKRELRRIDGEIDALRTSGTTVPRGLLEARRQIAAGVGVPASALPFAAELLEVRPEFDAWAGAIERVLRPLALTMLVRPEHLPAVRRWVDANEIAVRLVFEEAGGSAGPPRPAASSTSLVNRVRVAQGPFGTWLSARLSEQFDYACVETPDGMDEHVRAVTINGQIKSSRTRYEKDDRVRIRDRAAWVLGDRAAKLEALIALRATADAEVTAAQRDVDRAEERRAFEERRRGALATLREASWHSVDRSGAAEAVAALERRLAELTKADGALRDAIVVRQAAERDRDEASAVDRAAQVALDAGRAARAAAAEDEAGLVAEFDAGRVEQVGEQTRAELARRFRAVKRTLTRRELAEIGQRVGGVLIAERDAAIGRATHAGNDVTRLAAQFIDRWPEASAERIAAIDDRGGFIDMLDRILANGLPEQETRFRTLLRDRSRDLIGDLRGEILGATRAIQDRIDSVNAALRRSAFDEGRYLRLQVRQVHSATVKRFLAELKDIADDSWTDEDDASAERRFALLAELMRRFGSSDHIDRRWYAECLDTRLHATFRAHEVDEHDRVHATYDSGAAMSGGQQQKLVVFCLAAALRYQLADPDAPFSRYGTIVLDEAFDKADSGYTRMALNVFVEFGFQMILATPQKLLRTIEPYVGAATSVENPTRRRSVLAQVDWRGRG
ncbi:ATP-binding protein [Microbacterium lacusdiani]